MAFTMFSTVKTLDSKVYYLPHTLRNWPWQKSINPHYLSCKTESDAWLETLNPFTPKAQLAFNRCNFALLSALTNPKSSHFSLRSSCDLNQTFFVLDEQTDDEELDVVLERCDAAKDAILHPDKPRPEGESVIGEIARQFWKRASSEMPRSIIDRFETAWCGYVDSVIIQAQRRSREYICTMEEYITDRRHNIGSLPTFCLIEQCLGLDLPHEVMAHPLIQSLSDDITDLIIVNNDIFSYRKEVLANDYNYNAVTVVMKNLNLNLNDAIQWLSDYNDQSIDNFMRVRKLVLHQEGFPSWGQHIDSQISDYIDGLGNWIRGHDEWEFASGRYFGSTGAEIQRTRKVVIA